MVRRQGYPFEKLEFDAKQTAMSYMKKAEHLPTMRESELKRRIRDDVFQKLKYERRYFNEHLEWVVEKGGRVSILQYDVPISKEDMLVTLDHETRKDYDLLSQIEGKRMDVFLYANGRAGGSYFQIIREETEFSDVLFEKCLPSRLAFLLQSSVCDRKEVSRFLKELRYANRLRGHWSMREKIFFTNFLESKANKVIEQIDLAFKDLYRLELESVQFFIEDRYRYYRSVQYDEERLKHLDGVGFRYKNDGVPIQYTKKKRLDDVLQKFAETAKKQAFKRR